MMQVEMTFDPTPTNGPSSSFSAIGHAPDLVMEGGEFSGQFDLPDDEDYDQIQDLLLSLEMGEEDERFGFSVMGGIEEGFLPRVDEILPGSPADRSELDIGDEILEVNGKSLHNASHSEVISHIHQCVQSRTISLRVKRRMGLAGGEPEQENKRVKDAYVISVEQQAAKNKISKLAALDDISAADLSNLPPLTNADGNAINGFSDPVYTTIDGFSSEAGASNHGGGDGGISLVNGGYIAEPEIEEVRLSVERADPDFALLNGIQNEAYSGSTDSLPDVGLPNHGLNLVTTSAEVEPVLADREDSEASLPVEEPALERSQVAPVELPPLQLPPAEDENNMVVQTDVQPPQPERRAPREVAVDCPASFVAASGMKNPPPQYNHHQHHPHHHNDQQQPHLNGGSTVMPNGPEVTLNSHPVDRNGKQKGSPKKPHVQDIGSQQQNASQNNSQGNTLAFQPVTAAPLFDQRPEAARADDPSTNNRKAVELAKLMASLEHMQAKVEDPKNAEALRVLGNLFQNQEFQQALKVHNQVTKVHQRGPAPLPITGSAQEIAAEVKAETKAAQSPEAEELKRILERPVFKSLLSAHDNIASRDPTVLLGPEEMPVYQDPDMMEEDSVRIVRIDKTNEPLGATILNDGEDILIGRIIKGGMAERSGLLHEGDTILQINGNDVRGKSVNEICDFMSTLSGTLTFLMVPSKKQPILNQIPRNNSLIHMRAHFDYDPEDDMYIPCRELGLSFHKGDILHIIAQDDANWWQAYREGEEDQTLAGLIPSRTFQQQREAMKQTMPDDEEPKKKLFCGGKSKKKKKKKKLYNANAGDQSSEEILTYEEVGLYAPSPDKKRPVVLIGPPKVGRHELRQRLLESNEIFSAAVPHTSRPKKDHEVHGVDYYFTTRQRFEQDILAEKFVEHGEYEKNVYGTSLEAIRSVVDEGRICVLNLHPQSLKVLKNSDLRPYFIFICPPSLDRLRQQRTEAGDLLKEEELREIIETGRTMEDSYGHYFDYVIIHYDHDRAFAELLQEIDRIQEQPQWVPLTWLNS